MSDDDIYTLAIDGVCYSFRRSDVDVSRAWTTGGHIAITIQGGGGLGRIDASRSDVIEISSSEHERKRKKLEQNLAYFNAKG